MPLLWIRGSIGALSKPARGGSRLRVMSRLWHNHSSPIALLAWSTRPRNPRMSVIVSPLGFSASASAHRDDDLSETMQSQSDMSELPSSNMGRLSGSMHANISSSKNSLCCSADPPLTQVTTSQSRRGLERRADSKKPRTSHCFREMRTNARTTW
jgi:hypothetical protein